MANGITEVVEDGRIVRLNLSEPLVPGTRFVRKGIAYVVTGEGETAEPVGAAPGARITLTPGGAAAVFGWAALIAFTWILLSRRR